MDFATTLRVAVLALRRNLLRTILTMLSLVIGVTAVITIVALGRGASSIVEKEVMSAGPTSSSSATETGRLEACDSEWVRRAD